MLLLLRVQGLTSAAELFPGWGHPALWCPSARPTPWSWRCPEARERDGRVKEGRGERREGSWRWGWREASAEMTKVTKCMPERGDRRENVQIGKGGKKKGERRVRAEGTRMVCMGIREHPADTSNKTKDMGRKHTNTLHSYGAGKSSRQYMDEEKWTGKRMLKNLKNLTLKWNLAYSPAFNLTFMFPKRGTV